MGKLALAIALARFASHVVAEDILIAPDLGGTEQFDIIGGGVMSNGEPMLGMTVATPDADTWRAMTTEDFKQYKAILFGDMCKGDDDNKLISDTKDAWSAAITGNIAIVGLEHIEDLGGEEFALEVLQKNLINFAAGGTGTGLYYAIPCHDTNDVRTVDELSHFGKISVLYNPTNHDRGSLSNTPHLVADSELFITMNNSQISFDFEQDVSNIFIEFPTSGPEGFEVAVITTNTGSSVGNMNFPDGSVGAPFVITRNAIPMGCQNGVFDGQFGEECDPKVALLANTTDVCSPSCKCLKNFPGICPPPAAQQSSSAPLSSATGIGSPASSSSYVLSDTQSAVYSSSAQYSASSTSSAIATGVTKIYNTGGVYPTNVYPTDAYPTTASVDPTYSSGDICGVEIIFIIDIVETCPEGETVTVTSTRTISTVSRPIHRTKYPGYPCYSCMFGEPQDEYTTVFYDLCTTRSDYIPTVTAQLCHSCQYTTCATTELPGYTPGVCKDCSTYVVDEKQLSVPTHTTLTEIPTYATYTTTSHYLAVTAAAAPRATVVGIVGLVGGIAAAAAAAAL